MSFGIIRKCTEDGVGTYSGKLVDLEKPGDELIFSKQPGLDDVNRLDIVNYTDLGGGNVGDVTPNLKVNQKNLSTASPDVQAALNSLCLAAAKDKNEIVINIRKF